VLNYCFGTFEPRSPINPKGINIPNKPKILVERFIIFYHPTPKLNPAKASNNVPVASVFFIIFFILIK